MNPEIKENPKFMQECIVIDTTRLIKKYAEKYSLNPKWIASRYNDDEPKGRSSNKQMMSATFSRHKIIVDLDGMGYPRDLISRAFNLSRDSINCIIRKFRLKQNEQQH